MDPHRFDRRSRTLAGRLSRRNVLTGLGVGGIAAATTGVHPLLAQFDSVTCVYAFDGTVDVGPSSSLTTTSEYEARIRRSL